MNTPSLQFWPLFLGLTLTAGAARADSKAALYLRKRAKGLAKSFRESKECPKSQKYINGILKRIVSKSPSDFQTKARGKLKPIFLCDKTKSLPSAKLVAAKYLLVPASLILKSESEDAIAAVIAHEAAHFSLGHHLRLLKALRLDKKEKKTSGRKLRMFSLKKSHEKEADRAGLSYLINAGYNPFAAIAHLYSTLNIAKSRQKRTPAAGSSAHPGVDERASAITKAILETNLKAKAAEPVPKLELYKEIAKARKDNARPK